MLVSTTQKGTPITDPIGAKFLRPSVRDYLSDFILATSLMDFNRFLPLICHAPRDRPCYRIPVSCQRPHIVAVDESHFDEYGGHGGIPEHSEARVHFDDAIAVAEVNKRKRCYQLNLDAAGQSSFTTAQIIAIGFRAPAAAQIEFMTGLRRCKLLALH